MYYFKIQPPLAFSSVDNGVNKLVVSKTSSTTSVCCCTSPYIGIVRLLVECSGTPNPIGYKISRVNEKYFKLATGKLSKRVKPKEDDSVSHAFKTLISKSGQKLSQWIIDLTKYN